LSSCAARPKTSSVEGAHAAAAGSTAGPVDIEAALRRGQSLPSLLGSVDRRAVLFAMQECSGDRDAAARFLHIERDELDEKLRRYDAGDSSDSSDAPEAAG
jgi:DNA-binding NtrC family response regulator